MRGTLALAVATVLACLTCWPSLAEEVREAALFSLQRLKGRDAATILRSVAGVRGLQVVDERTVRVTDDPQVVALAKAVMDMAEHPSALEADVATHEAGDGTVVVSVHLEHAHASDAMAPLRQLGIKNIAVNTELSEMILRDTQVKVDAALAVLRQIESGAATKQ